MLSELGSYCMSTGINPLLLTFTTYTSNGSKLPGMNSLQQQPDSPLADLCTEAGRQQADSIIVSFFSAESPTGMFKQLPTDMAAQQALLSSVDRQLPPEAQQECEGPSEGITLAEHAVTSLNS